MSKTKKQQQIQKMKRMGFSDSQIMYMLKSTDKKANELEKTATEKAFLYMLAIPLNVLVSDYWEKSAKKRIPKFIEDCMSLYEAVQNGNVSDKELADLLWEYAGVKIDAEWIE